MDIKGSVAIVTGSSRGIGKAIALKLAEEKANIILNYNTQDTEAENFKNILKNSYKTNVFTYKADVSNPDEVKKMIQKTISYFGKIDILVNNAGIKGKNCEISTLSTEEWEKIINTNLKGVFNTCKFVVPYMIKQNKGVIINISSIAGLMGANVNIAYAASKAGIIGLSLALAAQVSKYNIRVNIIAPGAIDTSWWNNEPKIKDKLSASCPLKRLGNPEEIGEAVISLIKNDFINGIVLPVNGGRYGMRNIYYE
jgi:3-oxoacyl-[acyl-carrier protein] reductase